MTTRLLQSDGFPNGLAELGGQSEYPARRCVAKSDISPYPVETALRLLYLLEIYSHPVLDEEQEEER